MCRITPEQAGGKQVCAGLDAIAFSEIGPELLALPSADDGYRVNVGGQIVKTDYAHHPRIAVHTRYGWSDAFGRYQIMAAIPGKISTDTWDWAHRAAGVTDITPISQDKVCIYLIAHHGALEALKRGDLSYFFNACSKEWASLPGAGYGQHEQRMADLVQAYNQALSKY